MPPESRLIRDQRARQAAEADIALIELVAELLPDLLLDAFKDPRVRTSIVNIVAAASPPRKPTPTSGTTANPRRGGRRV